jgi:hypothetical protein
MAAKLGLPNRLNRHVHRPSYSAGIIIDAGNAAAGASGKLRDANGNVSLAYKGLSCGLAQLTVMLETPAPAAGEWRRALPLAILVGAVLALTGACATIGGNPLGTSETSAQKAQEIIPLLQTAGFDAAPATTPTEIDQLKCCLRLSSATSSIRTAKDNTGWPIPTTANA